MSETQADTAADTSTDAPAETATDDTTDWKAEAEKFKALARKQEDRAKANAAAAKELEEVRRQSMTEMEAAIDKAKSEARAETAQQFGSRLATEAVRAAAAGRVADVDALIEGIDARRFLGDDGEPDRAAIAAWVDRIAPSTDETLDIVRTLDLGQGARGSTPADDDAQFVTGLLSQLRKS